MAKKGDTVLITGMGHEQYRIINGKREPWNDGDVVRELLEDHHTSETSTSIDDASENTGDASTSQ